MSNLNCKCCYVLDDRKGLVIERIGPIVRVRQMCQVAGAGGQSHGGTSVSLTHSLF